MPSGRNERNGTTPVADPFGSLVCSPHADPAANEMYAEARALVERTSDIDGDIGRALVTAFARGYLDVPYCLHPDDANRGRGYRDGSGRLRWASVGAMPIATAGVSRHDVTADGLADIPWQVARWYDSRAPGGRKPEPGTGTPGPSGTPGVRRLTVGAW
jgi:methylaspartate mutase epsilon subunit